jgi:hypothetical protein
MYLDFTHGGQNDVREMVHVGRTGSFVPVKTGGGSLWRVKDGQQYAVTGTKGYSWLETPVAKSMNDAGELEIDMDYFDNLRTKALDAIQQFDHITNLFPQGD